MGGFPVYRQARLRPEKLPANPFVIEPPPVIQQPSPGPVWPQYLFPVVGGLGSLVFVVIYHNLLILIASGGVTLLSIGMGVGINLQRKRAIKNQEKAKGKAYLTKLNR